MKTSVAPLLGFIWLLTGFYGFIAAATLSYLAIVEGVKRPLLPESPRITAPAGSVMTPWN